MPETLPASYVAIKDAVHSIAPLVWLFKVDVDGTNAVRVAGFDVPITFSENGTPYVYSPFPVGLSGIVRDDSGSLPQPEFIVSNVTREIGARLEAGGIIDRICHIRIVNVNDSTASQDWGQWKVRGGGVSLQAARFQIGVGALADAPFPAVRVMRGRCPYVFGGLECGADPTLPNAISGTHPGYDPTTCTLLLEGDGGCRAHGANEAANGAAVLHPGRYGAFPSTPRGAARV